MKADAAEDRIKIIKDLIWQKVLSYKAKNKRVLTVYVYQADREVTNMSHDQFHDALMALRDSRGLVISNLTDEDILIQYSAGHLYTEPELYSIKVSPSWRDEYRKEIKNYTSTTLNTSRSKASEVVASYKDLNLYDNGDIRVKGKLLVIKGLKRDILSVLITNAPHVCSYADIRDKTGTTAENKSILKYRSGIQDILDDVGIQSSLHPHNGIGLKLEY